VGTVPAVALTVPPGTPVAVKFGRKMSIPGG
jgi:hypothetical protein